MENQYEVKETAPGAVASMVCGIVSMVTSCFPAAPIALGIIAIVLFAKVNKRIQQSGNKLGGKGMAIAGLVCGILGLVWGFFYTVYWLLLALGIAVGSAGLLPGLFK